MKYIYLALAIVFEVVGSGFLKASDGFSKPIATAVTLIAYLICFFFFSLALRELPLGLAYAVWGGLGIVLTALVSVFVFKQQLDVPALIGIALIVLGVFVLNFFSKTAIQ